MTARPSEPRSRATTPGGRPAGARLRVDPVACEGIGLCAHLAEGLVGLDRWGYPVVPTRDLDLRERPVAGHAVRACPRRALWVEDG